MFTGIVEKSVPVASTADHPGGRRLSLGVRWGDERDGESIAVNGCCLTIANIKDDGIEFDVVRQTLEKTNLGRLVKSDLVHVERSLRPMDRVDGHFVQGHVDGVAELIDRRGNDVEWRLRFRVEESLARYVIRRGSVSLDGVSLTVASVDGCEFEVALIPTTLQVTTLGLRPVGWSMNFEADILVKTVAAVLERMNTLARDSDAPHPIAR